MTLKEQYNTAIQDMFSPDFIGEKIIYNGQEINAIVKYIAPDPDKFGTRAVASKASIQILRENVPFWKYRDKVQLGDGSRWTVFAHAATSPAKFKLNIVNEERIKP